VSALTDGSLVVNWHQQHRPELSFGSGHELIAIDSLYSLLDQRVIEGVLAADPVTHDHEQGRDNI
jgi:hypothetical protein